VGFTYADIIEGNLDKDVFINALKELVNRHSVLRTTFEECEGIPHQIIHEKMDIPCPYYDLSNMADNKKKKVLSSRIKDEMETPLNLEAGPIYRMYLYKLENSKYILIRSIHPIAYDSWSTTVFMKDLSSIYKLLRNGENLGKLTSALQYVDFTEWQKELLNNGELNEQKEYWYKQLEGMKEKVEFPYLDSKSKLYESMNIKNLIFDSELMEKIKNFALSNGTTVYITLLAAFSAWISLNTGKTDISICSPISGRTHPDLEEMLGVVVNPVILRTNLNGNPSCMQILDQVKEVAVDAYANQDYPFDLLVQDIRERYKKNDSLYSIVFVGQNAHNGFIDLNEEVSFRRYNAIEDLLEDSEKYESSFADYSDEQIDLHIELFEGKDRVSLRVQYNNKKFTSIDIEEFFKQYKLLLGKFISNPHTLLSQLSENNLVNMDELFY
jgi:hypothetical protein